MNKRGSRRTLFIGLLFAIFCVVMIVLDNRGALDPLKTGVRNLVSPVVEWVDDLWQPNQPTTDVEIELQQVTEQRDALLAENAQLKLDMEDVEELRKVVDFQEANPSFQMVTASVVGTDPSGLQKFITIDRGSFDGIEVGMAVVDPYYFVGLVTAVEERSARITLAIDATSNVGAKLLESKGVGIVYGEWQSGGRMTMQHVDRAIVPVDGEAVVTSDEAEVRTARVPGGLIIGQVSGVPELDNQSDSLVIQVLPASDFDNLSMVTVIIDDTADSE